MQSMRRVGLVAVCFIAGILGGIIGSHIWRVGCRNLHKWSC